jgi:hypothetical protein
MNLLERLRAIEKKLTDEEFGLILVWVKRGRLKPVSTAWIEVK